MIRTVLLLLALAAAPLEAQLAESMTVEVVEVPVYVTRNGKPVRGLARKDFTLLVDGKAQPIEYFDVVDRRVATPRGAAPELHRRRIAMLLFDTAHSSPWALRRAQKSAAVFVAQAAASDAYAVATMTGSGIRLLVPFTTHRMTVLRAIATLSVSARADAFGIATTDAERTAWTVDPMYQPDAEAMGLDLDMPPELACPPRPRHPNSRCGCWSTAT